MKHGFLACALATALCSACGDSSVGAGGMGGGGSAGRGGEGGSSVDGALTVEWGPTEVAAGTEGTRCVVKRLGNESRFFAHQIRNELGATSHHFIVYRVSDTEERPEPFPCQPFTDTLNPSAGAPLMIMQRADDTLTLPDGVVYEFQPNQMIRLELHYVNVTASAQTASATSTFIPIPEDEVVDRADIVFMGETNISIPPQSSASAGPSFIRLPAVLDGASFFAVTGHEHQWGTNVYVEVAESPEAPGVAVYDVPVFLWDEPETVEHDPPFTVPSGGGFKLTCDWTNRSDDQVGFGTSVDDEMCFFWAYYYPSQGAIICAPPLGCL